jgi:hypothetical protein
MVNIHNLNPGDYADLDLSRIEVDLPEDFVFVTEAERNRAIEVRGAEVTHGHPVRDHDLKGETVGQYLGSDHPHAATEFLGDAKGFGPRVLGPTLTEAFRQYGGGYPNPNGVEYSIAALVIWRKPRDEDPGAFVIIDPRIPVTQRPAL